MARIHGRAVVLAYVTALLIVANVEAKGPEPKAGVAPGTQIVVRIKDKLRSDAAKAGDQFRGRLETPITVNGQVLYPKGTEVAGYVVRAHASAGEADAGVLELDLMAIGEGMNMTSLKAKTLVLKGELHEKSKEPVMIAKPTDGKGKKDSRVESNAVLSWVAAQPGGVQDWSQNAPRDVRRGAGTPFRIVGHEPAEEPKAAEPARYAFSERDRKALRTCVGARAPRAAQPIIANQVQKGRPLSAALQKKAQPLPAACSQQLSPVPREWARVMVSGRVMLLDPGRRIVDVFAF